MVRHSMVFRAVVGIADPANPILLGSLRVSSALDSAYAVVASGALAFVAATVVDGVAVVDVSNSASPSVVGSVASSA